MGTLTPNTCRRCKVVILPEDVELCYFCDPDAIRRRSKYRLVRLRPKP